MDKQIDFITLIFENCDYINIPYKVINMLRLYRVSYNYNFYQNKTDISATAEYILISLNINLIKDIKSGKLAVDVDVLKENPNIVSEMYMNQQKIITESVVDELLKSNS